MSEIVLKNVNKTYENGYCAVKDFNIDIRPQEFLILVGPSGCGKSTTLRMIAGLEEITRGELWVDNELTNFTPAKKRNLSMVFQNYALYPHMTVYENIAYALKVRKTPRKEMDLRVKEVAKMLGIETLLNQKPKELSGGQKQRVAIGGAIVRESKVLLMDEPLSNLDAKLRNQMRVELASLHKKLNNTIIYVTHDQTEAMTLGTRIVVMNEGEVQQIDTPDNLYRNPVNMFVAGFIGSPAMNFIDGSITCTKDGAVMQYMDQTMKMTKFQEKQFQDKGYLNKQVIIGVRPESFWIVPEHRVNENNSMEITVEHIENLGKEFIIYFQKTGKQYAIRTDDKSVEDGQKIHIQIKPYEICFFDPSTKENLFAK